MGHLLTGEVRADLDRMLLVDVGLGMARLEWLNSPARDASASSVKIAIDKLTWFRSIDAPQMDLSALPNERRRFLAQVRAGRPTRGCSGARSASTRSCWRRGLGGSGPAGRGRGAVRPGGVGPGVPAKSRTEEALAERAKKGEARQLLMDVILPVLADPSVPDELVGGRLRNEIGMQRLREITSDSWKPLAVSAGVLLG